VLEEAKVKSDEYVAQIRQAATLHSQEMAAQQAQHAEAMNVERATVRRLTDEMGEMRRGYDRQLLALGRRERRTTETVKLLDERLRGTFPVSCSVPAGCGRGGCVAAGAGLHPLLIFSRFLLLPAAIYPESQACAEDAVQAFRAAQLEEGVNVTLDTPWAMEDYAVACHARLAPIDDLMLRLFESVHLTVQALWPDMTTPREIGELADWLSHGAERVDEWRASAARAGAEMALSFVLSWYDEV
jgi:hypothetical protein